MLKLSINTSFDNFENKLNDLSSDEDWGYFIDFEDNYDYINKNNQQFYSNKKKIKSIYFKPIINFTPIIKPITSIINSKPLNKNLEEEKYEKEEKIIQIYNQVCNCLINSFVTISIIYFILKL